MIAFGKLRVCTLVMVADEPSEYENENDDGQGYHEQHDDDSCYGEKHQYPGVVIQKVADGFVEEVVVAAIMVVCRSCVNGVGIIGRIKSPDGVGDGLYACIVGSVDSHRFCCLCVLLVVHASLHAAGTEREHQG